MTQSGIPDDVTDLLGWWAAQADRPDRVRDRLERPTGQVWMDFAFYGRMSTIEWQDRLSSARWQRNFADDLVDGVGQIVAEYFDVGCRRSTSWTARPQGKLLLEALQDPDRTFNAIVVGEFERAFYGEQFAELLPLLSAAGVQLWLPELSGPVDPANSDHMAILSLLGVHSRREIQRARFRAKAAMQAQVLEQGRHMGGRPPYGYRLIRSGLHPNPTHARWGRPFLRLHPHPKTAGHVEWMFAQRLAGCSVNAIARALNEQRVPCPSKVDPDRNRHRAGVQWHPNSVRAILANPRYTGRQVWNRQTTKFGPLDNATDLLGESEARRWNLLQEMTISKNVVHPALVSERDFVTAQLICSVSGPRDGSARVYTFAGLIRCGVCERMLDSHWNNQPTYRCRHGNQSGRTPEAGHPKTVYITEATVTAKAALLLGQPVDRTLIADRLRDTDTILTCADSDTVGMAAQRMPARIPRPRRSAVNGQGTAARRRTTAKFYGPGTVPSTY